MTARARRRLIDADDGWRLDVVDLLPVGPPRGLIVVGHAMMVDRRTIYRQDRPSLCGTLSDHGFRVLALDLRGHGGSGPSVARGGSWSYDDLVADVGVYLRHARALAPELPIGLVGNSLFGHLTLAWLGLHPEAPVAAVVGFAVNIWNRRWDASSWRGAVKRALLSTSRPLAQGLGRLPVRRLGLGQVDEPLSYWRTMLARDRWGSPAGVDYAVNLPRVQAPFLHVLSDGDRLMSHPDDALLFSASLPAREVLRLGKGCREPNLLGLRPGHVEMVASPRFEPLWRHTAGWLASKLSPRAALDGRGSRG